MIAVYRRESTTRQDVLESNFHYYMDQLVLEAEEAKLPPKPVRRLLPAVDDRMIEAPEGVYDSIEKVFDYEIDIDRLLGGLVQPMQAYGSGNREVGAGIRGPD